MGSGKLSVTGGAPLRGFELGAARLQFTARDILNSFGGATTCGFHDHNEPDNDALKGTITIR